MAQIGIIEQNKKDKSPQIINFEYDMIKKNKLYQIDNLFEANQVSIITKKNYLEEENLLSQKQYWSSSEKFFYKF